MSNEQTTDQLRAGQLTSGHIGKTIRVAVSAHVTVEDVIEAVGHVGPPPNDRKTLIMFEHTTPDNMGDDVLGGLFAQLHPKRGFLLLDIDRVTVVR